MRNRLSVARIRALSKPGRYADGGTLYLMAAYAGVAFQIAVEDAVGLSNQLPTLMEELEGAL